MKNIRIAIGNFCINISIKRMKYYRLCSGALNGEIVGWTSDEYEVKRFENEWPGNKAVEISYKKYVQEIKD